MVGVTCTYIFFTAFGTTPKPHPLRQSDFPEALSKYQFIDPLIGSTGGNNAPQYGTLEQDITEYISSQKQKGLIAASVYFRDINDVSAFSVYPEERYTPASLYKVPVMMAYLKAAEAQPSLLTTYLTYSGTEDRSSVQEIRPTKTLVPGRQYSAETLLTYMLAYSDNNAAGLLRNHLKDTNNLESYAAVFSDLGIDLSSLLEYTDTVTPQQYGIFFRALYNATYLSRDASEHALSLLAQSDFKNGIVAGVPSDTTVAHKFGEVRMTSNTGKLIGKQLHDCGIVYYPKHPYLLCIMTKAHGDDIAGLEETISTISHLVYTDMQRRYP